MLGKKNKEVKIGTLLGNGAQLHGNFTAPESARIDGRVNGDVTVEGTLVVGSTGAITGNVSAEAVLIGGEVLGNIVAPEKAELTATAKVLGDIATKVIVIDENAVFQGKVDMNQNMPENKPSAKTKRTALKPVGTGKKNAKTAIAEALREVAEKEQEEAAREEEQVVKEA